METFDYNGKTYDIDWESADLRHGGPFDRGSADSYYGRPRIPHFYTGYANTSQRVDKESMSKEDIESYYAGYAYNEMLGDKKIYG